jgi:hypothetical protein
MKAMILERNVIPKCKLPKPERFSVNLLGEVDPLQIVPGDPMCDELLALLPRYGLKRKNPKHYSSPSFISLYGSVGWHHDSPLGNLLTWFVKKQSFDGSTDLSTVQLITRSCVLDLHVGDVFIFDSNIDHAWISNSTCTLLQVAVSGRAVQKKT